jgi:hypothetical protein
MMAAPLAMQEKTIVVRGLASGAALAVPAASAMPEAATHTMAEIATAEVAETCSMIDAATHAMTEAVAEFAVLTVLASIDTVG